MHIVIQPGGRAGAHASPRLGLVRPYVLNSTSSSHNPNSRGSLEISPAKGLFFAQKCFRSGLYGIPMGTAERVCTYQPRHCWLKEFPIDVEGVSAGRQCRAPCEIAYSLIFFVDCVVPQCYCDLFVPPCSSLHPDCHLVCSSMTYDVHLVERSSQITKDCPMRRLLWPFTGLAHVAKRNSAYMANIRNIPCQCRAFAP